MIGKTLAHYEIRDLLGEGGMGQVYRALDTRLDREVAIKLLPPQLAEDAERLARLKREAKTLASIHHARVATLFGIEEVEGYTFLAMELVEGPTLAELLEARRPALDETIELAKQIAEGLVDAHAKGVVHRDLKPANIKVAPGDQIKILDFGLARAYVGDPMSGDDLANSPTITQAMTQAGVILGTAAYMSPEQAKGKAVDLRSDIWSFGVILFEMLCGSQLFAGETVSETMADVMKGDLEWNRLPSDTPPWLRQLLERCLDRDPGTRLQSIAEARIALERGGPDQEPAAVTAPVAAATRNWWPALSAVLVTAMALMWFGMRQPAPEPMSMRFQITTDRAVNLRILGSRHVAISPDGSRIASVGEINNDSALLVRDLDAFEWKSIQGADEAFAPTFSPDGKWLAFLAPRTVNKVNLNGGAPIELLTGSGYVRGIDWADDGYLYGAYSGELWRLSTFEPTPELETIHVFENALSGEVGPPHVLPGSKALLFHVGSEGASTREIFALDLRTKESKRLGISGTDPRFVAPDALVFAQGEQVLAVGFDPERLEVRGAPIPVLDRVWIEELFMQLDISETGTVAYLPDLGRERPKMLLVDRQGIGEELVASDPGFTAVSDPRLSPDGTQLVVSANQLQLWVIDLPTETPSLLSESGFYPVWTRDGREVLYGSTRSRSFDLFRIPANLSRPEEVVLDWDRNLRSAAMAPDGTFIFREEIVGKGMDLWAWPDVDDTTSMAKLLDGPDDELSPAVSPDSRWLAYVSNFSGQDEVYVTAFPERAGRVQVSSGGGIAPVWSPDGQELFYVSGNTMIAANVEAEPTFRVLSREELFSGAYLQYRWHRQFDITPDGEHFVMILNPQRGMLEVVTNWLPTLEQALRDAE